MRRFASSRLLAVLAVIFLGLLLPSIAPAQISPGASKEEVINLLGWPVSSSGNSNRELLNYEECSVLLEHGKLVKLEFKNPDSRQILFKKLGKVDGSVSAEPVAAKPAEPLPATTVPAAPAERPAPAPHSRVQSQEPEPPKTWGIYKTSALVAAVLIVITIMGYKKWSAEKKDFVKLQRELLIKGNTQSEPPYRPTQRSLITNVPTSEPFAKGWTLGLLKELEWHRFQIVVAAYERELGHDARQAAFGADDGIDIKIFENGAALPSRVILCKAHGQQVKIDLVRAFYEVMEHENVAAGSFFAPDGFTTEAMAFAAGKNLELIDGTKFIARIKVLDQAAQFRLLQTATDGDYKTPTCATCGIKMKLVGEPERAHWGCVNFPR
ncbi:MAG: topoisomerase, partial [Verrucomicrobia bacterium]|nr:topoisomerase [Verrucomicrobiota bacterium]